MEDGKFNDLLDEHTYDDDENDKQPLNQQEGNIPNRQSIPDKK
jgi:hypothetical protein